MSVPNIADHNIQSIVVVGIINGTATVWEWKKILRWKDVPISKQLSLLNSLIPMAFGSEPISIG